VTIAVVAERGPVKFSRAPVAATREEEESAVRGDGAIQVKAAAPAADKQKQASKPSQEDTSKAHGKKYVNMKLIDFGARSASSSSSKAAIRGDAFLTLLLFESDGVETAQKEDGGKERIYKGGSRGAFEKMTKLKEGSVVALLNPRILKPFQVRLRRSEC
jgi:minichromosome maintenance protein 10